tara:strand:+ start:103 stop:372 length:270 start_codon:yes stop_codon:yes gene_type:complete
MDINNLDDRAKVIWDSGFGYEIGFFIRVSDDIVYNTVIIELITGNQLGSALRSKDSIVMYDETTLKQMYKKYKYWNQFPYKENLTFVNQ